VEGEKPTEKSLLSQKRKTDPRLPSQLFNVPVNGLEQFLRQPLSIISKTKLHSIFVETFTHI
jgi:hypothetical protein